MRAFAFSESIVLFALLIPAPACSGGGSASSEADGSNAAANDAAAPNDVETDADNAAMDATASPFTDPYGGASGCDGGVVVSSKPCQLKMTVSGAVSGTLLGGEGCQWGKTGNGPPLLFGTGELGPAPWHGTEVDIRPQQPIGVGSVGSVGSVEVLLTAYPTDGGQMQWATPFTCSLRLYSDACVREASTAGLYALAGTGTCDDVAQPVGGMGPPVTIGEFSFALEYATP